MLNDKPLLMKFAKNVGFFFLNIIRWLVFFAYKNLNRRNFIVINLILFLYLAIPVSVNAILNTKKIKPFVLDALHRATDAKVSTSNRMIFRAFSSSIELGGIQIVYDDHANELHAQDPVENTANIGSVVIKIGLFSLFSGRLDIKSLRFVHSSFTVGQIKKILYADRSERSAKVPKLYFQDSELVIGRKFSTGAKTLRNLNGMLQVSDSADFVISSNFAVSGRSYALDIQSKANSSASEASLELHLISDVGKVDFQGSVRDMKHNPEADGKIKSEGKNLVQFLQDIGDTDYTSLFGGVSTNDQQYSINGDIVYRAGKLELQNLKLESLSINGDFVMDLQKPSGTERGLDNWRANIIGHIANIDIDRLTNGQNPNIESGKIEVIKDLNFTINPGVVALIRLQIKDVKYKQKNIRNIDISSSIANGVAAIQQLSCNFFDQHQLQFRGAMTSDDVKSTLRGDLQLTGSKSDTVETILDFFAIDLAPSTEMLRSFAQGYSLTGQLVLMPYIKELNNFNIKTGVFNLYGSLSSRNLAKKDKTGLYGDVSVNFFNFDSSNFAKLLFAKKGSAPMINDSIQWIKNKYDLDLTMRFDRLIFGGHTIQDARFVLDNKSDEDAILNLRNIKVNSPKINLEGDIKLVYGLNFSPRLYMDLKSKKFEYFSKNYVRKKPITVASERGFQQVFWPLKPFTFFGVENFTGKIKLFFQNFIYDNTSFDNLYLDLSFNTKNKTVQCRRIILDKYGGRTSFSGDLAILGDKANNINVSGVLSLDKLYLPELVKQMSGSTDVKDGYWSASGTFSSTGNNIYNVMNSASGEFTMEIDNLTVNNFGMDDMVSELANSDTQIPTNHLIERALYADSTTFRSISGTVKMKDGISAISARLTSEYTVGVLSMNMSNANIMMNGLMKIAFIVAPASNIENAPAPPTALLNMDLHGILFYPKRSLNSRDLDLAWRKKQEYQNWLEQAAARRQ